MKSYVKIFYDWEKVTEALSAAEKGRLIDAIVIYASRGEIVTMSGGERYVFPGFRAQIDRDEKVYNSKVVNGQKGGLAKVSEFKRNVAKCSETKQEEEKEKDKEEEKENKKEIKKKKDFSPPSIKEIKNYISEKKLNVDAEKFFDYFSEGNWHDSNGKPVLNWKQKILTWQQFNSANEPPKRNATYDIDEYEKLLSEVQRS